MNKKKIFGILIFCFTIVLLVGIGYQFSKNQALKEDMKKLQTNKLELENNINALIIENNTLKNQIENLNYQTNHQPKPEPSNKACTFIRTYHYLETLEVKGQGNETLIVVQPFQSNPFILRLENNFNTKFEKNAAYEFKFTGRALNDDKDENSVNQFSIVSIQKTDKVGLEQLQEPCRMEE